MRASLMPTTWVMVTPAGGNHLPARKYTRSIAPPSRSLTIPSHGQNRARSHRHLSFCFHRERLSFRVNVDNLIFQSDSLNYTPPGFLLRSRAFETPLYPRGVYTGIGWSKSSHTRQDIRQTKRVGYKRACATHPGPAPPPCGSGANVWYWGCCCCI